MLKLSPLYVLVVLLFSAICAGAAETKDITFKFKNAEPVTFSHAFHLSKYNNNCKMCHNVLYDLKARKRYTMADMEKTKSCGACHTGIKAFSVASEKDCIRCHKGKPRDVVYPVKGLSSATFSHSVHIAKTGGACRGCHNGKVITGREKNVTMAEMEKGKTCGACHNGSKAFTVAGNCDKCHKGAKPADITFKLKDVTPAVFSHSFHTQAYACKDCHTKVFPYKALVGKSTMDDMSKGKSCGTCHNGKDAFSTSGDCYKCHKGHKPPAVVYKTDAGEATFSHDFHTQAYKCADCHTKVFQYKAHSAKASMTDMEKGKSCGTCHNAGKDAFSVKDDKLCEKCHKM